MAQGAGSTITQRIALEGGPEVKKELDDVGAHAKEAFGKVGDSAKSASDSSSGFGSALGDLAEKLGLPVHEAEKLGDVVTGLDFTAGIGGLAALGAAVVAAGVAFLALGEHAATATRDIENQARILGMTSEAFEGVMFAAGQVGVGAEAANRGLDRLQVTIGKAREEQEKLANGGKAAFDSTQAVIDQLAAGHTKGLDLLAATADAFKGLTDEQAKAALGNKLMGKSWAEQAPLLALGGDAIRALAKRWDELEISATDAEKKMAGSYAGAASELRMVTEGLTNAVGNIVGQLFTPGMKALAEALSGGQQSIREFTQELVDHLQPAFQYVAEYARSFVQALQDITAVINKVFGTNFSTVMVVATALLVAFARPFVVMTAAIVLVEAALKAVFGPDSPIDPAKIGGYTAALTGVVYVVRSLSRALYGLWLNPFSALLAGAIALGVVLIAINGDTKAMSEAIKKYLGEDAAKSFDGLVEGIKSGWEAVKGFMFHALDDMGAAFDNWMKNSESAAAGLLRVITLIAAKLSSANAQVATLGSEGSAAMSPGFDPGDLSQKLAGGGLIRGPGSATSDSILARLSDGEFVIRASAVNHFGVGTFEALNRLRTPQFSLGGLVEGLSRPLMPRAPRFATGGLVAAGAGGGRSQFTLVLDRQSFTASGPENTVRNLMGAARKAQLLSGGRKPSSHR